MSPVRHVNHLDAALDGTIEGLEPKQWRDPTVTLLNTVVEPDPERVHPRAAMLNRLGWHQKANGNRSQDCQGA
jgi:hypothetical protein